MRCLAGAESVVAFYGRKFNSPQKNVQKENGNERKGTKDS